MFYTVAREPALRRFHLGSKPHPCRDRCTDREIAASTCSAFRHRHQHCRSSSEESCRTSPQVRGDSPEARNGIPQEAQPEPRSSQAHCGCTEASLGRAQEVGLVQAPGTRGNKRGSRMSAPPVCFAGICANSDVCSCQAQRVTSTSRRLSFARKELDGYDSRRTTFQSADCSSRHAGTRSVACKLHIYLSVITQVIPMQSRRQPLYERRPATVRLVPCTSCKPRHDGVPKTPAPGSHQCPRREPHRTHAR